MVTNDKALPKVLNRTTLIHLYNVTQLIISHIIVDNSINSLTDPALNQIDRIGTWLLKSMAYVGKETNKQQLDGT